MAKPRSAAHLAYGRALRELRVERGISQERLALTAQLDRTYYSGIERGERHGTHLLDAGDGISYPSPYTSALVVPHRGAGVSCVAWKRSPATAVLCSGSPQAMPSEPRSSLPRRGRSSPSPTWSAAARS